MTTNSSAKILAANVAKLVGNSSVNSVATRWRFPQRTLAVILSGDPVDSRLSTVDVLSSRAGLAPWQLLVENLDPANPPRLAAEETATDNSSVQVLSPPDLPTGGSMAERIRQARQAERLSQVELARLAGMAQASISALERGHETSTRELLAIASGLRRRPEWLRYGTGPETPSADGWDFSTPRAAYDALSPRAKAKIDEYIVEQAILEGALLR